MTFSLAPEKTGTYVLREKLTSAQMNKIKTILEAALDPVGGGIYTLHGADLQLSTDAAKKFILDLACTLTATHTMTIDDAIILIQGASGRLNLTAGAGINLFHGSALNLDGASGGANITTESGSLVDIFGLLNIESGGVMQLLAGAALNVITGAVLDVSGQIAIESGGNLNAVRTRDITISSEVYNLRLNLIDGISDNAGADWQSLSAALWQPCQRTATVSPYVHPVRGLNPGDTIDNVVASIFSSTSHSGGMPANKPILELFYVDSNGVAHSIATTHDPSSTFAVYDAVHQIPLAGGTVDSGAMPYTVDVNPLFVRLLGEWGSGSHTQSVTIASIQLSGKRNYVMRETVLA